MIKKLKEYWESKREKVAIVLMALVLSLPILGSRWIGVVWCSFWIYIYISESMSNGSFERMLKGEDKVEWIKKK